MDDDYEYDDFLDDLDGLLDECDVEEFEDEGCCFPGECLMPGDHVRSECHTVEMMEDQQWGTDGQALDQFMDCLTHSDDDWTEECRGGIVRTPDGDLSLLVLVQDTCLSDPELSQWRNAFVWQLCEKYSHRARVLLRHEIAT